MSVPTPTWAEGVATQVEQREPSYVVKGGISPSGPIHVGHLNEILRPYFVAEELRERGYEVTQYLTIDDMDPLQSIPEKPVVPEEDIGKPLVEAEVLGPSGRSSFADVYVNSIESVLTQLGMLGDVEIRRASEKYLEPEYDEYVNIARENESAIQEIMENYQDTEYEVYNGTKLGWRVEWAVQWALLDVDFEPFGKDHAESSYDSACDVAQEVLNIEPPVPLEYEWFTIEGEAMSSSEGTGIEARELLYRIGEGATKYLYSRNPRKQRELRMRDIHQIVSDYDNLVGYEGPSYLEAASYWLGDEDSSRRLFEYSDYDEQYYRRVQRAGRWAELYNDKYDFTLVEPAKRDNPSRVVSHILTDRAHTDDAEELQNCVYEWAEHFDESAGDVFSQLYGYLLGRDDGPRAGRLLAAISEEQL